ncbi:hypothetical protein, partial [Phaeobacter sp. B1627]|uniref:hypothetical protein n=1 Tax=Phaeobacter sp. B1627 TaxID=2583809 RepID=UPI002102D441
MVKLNGTEKLAPSVVEPGVKVMLIAAASEPPAATVLVAMVVVPKLAFEGVPWVRPERLSGPVPL